MTFGFGDRLTPFRDKAIERGIPPEDVENWLMLARPCATLTQSGDGPVVGRFGGPLLLPADVPDPAEPFVATLDLAALPSGCTDLPLPRDGQLLLFAFPEDEGECVSMGSVVHVPVGTAVVERDRNAWNEWDVDDYETMFEEFPQGPLRAVAAVSLPNHHAFQVRGERTAGPIPGHPRSEDLVGVWQDTREAVNTEGSLQIGGYADEEAVYTDPLGNVVRRAVRAAEKGNWEGPVSDDVADWVLLADWYAGADVSGWESATVHWGIQRDDLAAGRFDRAFAQVFYNP
ncbi:DUF1963 domain-containing protein [Lentzea albida]|uniref:DUF1963 domain-containing protein n=1 Tax=Lentzea albida TaxID=65499 RepID=A0A1H9GHH9_9PSEU|nr:DUF1963 domain-containing protein [Lentzea albida]SEQ49489.1 protein of unknown function [Lentzea albida]